MKKNKLPLISICVISYNNAKYLPDCINSILKQKYKNIEIVFCDDASTDDSVKVFEELVKNNKRIKSGEIIINRQYRKVNGGTGGAEINMLTGLKGFTGEYVCNIDSDDVLSPNHLSTLYDLMTKYNADIARVDHIEFNEKLPTIVNKKFISDKYDTSDMIGAFYWEEGKEIPFAYWHGLYKKQFAKKVSKLPKKFFANSDSAFSVAQFAEAKTIVQSSQQTYYYRVIRDSTSHKSRYKYLKTKTYNSLEDLSEYYKDKIPRLIELNQQRNTKCIKKMFVALKNEKLPYKEWKYTWKLSKNNDFQEIREFIFGDVLSNNYKKRLLRKSFNLTPLWYYLWQKINYIQVDVKSLPFGKEIINWNGAKPIVVEYKNDYFIVKQTSAQNINREMTFYNFAKDYCNIPYEFVAKRRLEKKLASNLNDDITLGDKSSGILLIKVAQTIKETDLPNKNVDKANAAEFVFSLFFRRRDIGIWNKTFIDGSIPVFYDLSACLDFESGLDDVNSFFSYNRHGYGGSWRVKVLKERIPNIEQLRAARDNKIYINSKEEFNKYIDYFVDIIKHINLKTNKDIVKSGYLDIILRHQASIDADIQVMKKVIFSNTPPDLDNKN